MYYEILVVKHGQHFFATDERSITTLTEAVKVYAALRGAFAKKDGYDVTVSFHYSSSEDMTQVVSNDAFPL